MERKLAAILAADVVGYAGLLGIQPLFKPACQPCGNHRVGVPSMLGH